jgi:hypothetical protein
MSLLPAETVKACNRGRLDRAVIALWLAIRDVPVADLRPDDLDCLLPVTAHHAVQDALDKAAEREKP